MAKIKTVGVIGAGQMGTGIAHVCALAGFNVKLNDVSLERVNSGLATINGNMARQVSKNAISEDERKRSETEVQKLTDDAIAEIDATLAAKDKEILQR